MENKQHSKVSKDVSRHNQKRLEKNNLDQKLEESFWHHQEELNGKKGNRVGTFKEYKILNRVQTPYSGVPDV